MNNRQAVQHNTNSIQNICAGAFSLLLLVSIAVCAICDMAISHTLTWALYPISSIIFAWAVFIPIIKFGKKGIFGSLIACSVFIVPFLYVLDKLIKASNLFLPIGISMAFIGILYLWIVFILFKKLQTRKLLAAAIMLLLAIPADALITFTLSAMVSNSVIDIWDILGFSIAVTASIVLFSLDFTIQKKHLS